MRLIPVAGVLGLCLAAHSVEAQLPAIPDAATVQAAAAGARQALTQNDPDVLVDATLRLYEQLMRLPDGDSRMIQLLQLNVQLTNAHRQQTSDAEGVELLETLNGMSEGIDRNRNAASWSLVQGLAQIKAETGDLRGAADVLASAIAREEPRVGSEFPAVRSARTLLARTMGQLGDVAEALELQERTLAATTAIYGEGTAESAETLVTMAQLNLQIENYRTAIELADKAAPIIRDTSLSLTPLVDQLGQVYLSAAQIEKALEMFQITERTIVTILPNVADVRYRVFANLATANARLGDGAAARRYVSLLLDLAQSSFQASPRHIYEAMALEARVFALAGLFDEARASLARVEDLAGRNGASETAAFKSGVAFQYLEAMDSVRAAELAGAALAMVGEDDPVYGSAGSTFVIASALLEPPVSRLDLAMALLEKAEREQPALSHARERYTLALALAADGQWEESAAMQKAIIDEELAEAGQDMTNQVQLTTYAMALEQLGQSDELARVTAALEGRRAPLALALAGQLGRDVLVQQRSAFGFEVELGDPHWQRSRGEAIGRPQAAFAASYYTDQGQGDGSLSVYPILLSEVVDSRLAVDAMLDFVYTQREGLETWSDGDFSGYTVRTVQPHFQNGLPVVYLSRIIVEPTAVYVINTSATQSMPAIVAAAEVALDSVRIVRGASVADLSPAEREIHGRLLNRVGTVLFQEGRYAEARDVFQHASEYSSLDFVTENLGNAHYLLGDFREAIATFDANFARFGETRENASEQLWRADSHLRLGENDIAMEGFAKAFSLGAVNDEFADVYAGLLLEADRGADAIAFLDGYVIASGTVDAHAIRALSAYEVGDGESLADSLGFLRDPAKSTPEGAMAVAFIVLDRDGHVGLAELSLELAADALDSPELYLILAGAQWEVGRADLARATLAKGIERFPGHLGLEDAAKNLPAPPKPPDA